MEVDVHTKGCSFSCLGCSRYAMTIMSEGSYRSSCTDNVSHGRTSSGIPERYLYEGGLKSCLHEFTSHCRSIKLAYYALRIVVYAKVTFPRNYPAH
jgi:hypothetical protein